MCSILCLLKPEKRKMILIASLSGGIALDTSAIIFMIIRKYVRVRKSLVEQEELLGEVADLNKSVLKLRIYNQVLNRKR